MAERRMFSKTIIDSDNFLDMPLSTQALYFHLSMRADDDGFINNPKKIQKMIGSSEDDLKLLIVKQFVLPFDSGIVVIKHWKIHNYIRNDRYKETIYQEEKTKLSIDDNNTYIFDGMSLGIPNGYQMDTQVRLGKDSIGKVSKDIYTSETDGVSTPKIDYAAIKEYFNTHCTAFPSIREMTESRKKAIKNFLKNHSEADLYQLFTMAQTSDFLAGSTGWKAGFDWILKPANSVKILEGNYENKISKKTVEPKGFQGIYEFMQEG